jgi:cell wall-associated NlpC family hydrolase
MDEPALKPAATADDASRVQAALAEPPTARRPMRRLTVAAALAGACALAVLVFSLVAGGSSDRRSATAASRPSAVAALKPGPAAAAAPAPKPLRSHPKVVMAVPPGEAPPAEAGTPTGTSTARPPSDAEVRSELSAFRQHLTGYGVARGRIPEVRSDGTAVAPLEAPDVVATVIAAGNEIATKPYKWGGGHGAWRDKGYDCSGSVSFALAGAGLMTSPLTSGGFMKWGARGPGRWITIYANQGHMFMVVAGLRFDTSGAQGGTRWQPAAGRSYAGFTQRHPPGL